MQLQRIRISAPRYNILISDFLLQDAKSSGEATPGITRERANGHEGEGKYWCCIGFDDAAIPCAGRRTRCWPWHGHARVSRWRPFRAASLWTLRPASFRPASFFPQSSGYRRMAMGVWRMAMGVWLLRLAALCIRRLLDTPGRSRTSTRTTPRSVPA